MNKIIIMMLILVSIVYAQQAIPTGENVITKTIFTVPVCYDVTLVLVSSEKQTVKGDYVIEGCELYESNKWRCVCPSQGANLTLNIISNKSNTYDVRVQYYVKPLLPEFNNSSIIENDNSKRIENINNIIISIPKKPFNLTNFVTNNKWPIIVLLGIIVFIFIDVVIVIRWLFRDNTPKRQNFIKTDKKQTKNDDLTDEEVLELVKKL